MVAYHYTPHEKYHRINQLRKTLDEKANSFSEETKALLGYYFLTDLMERVPQLNFRNYDAFCRELAFVIQEFPVENNGKVRYGDFLTHFSDFKEYIKKEFGFVQKNNTFNRRFWQWFVLIFIATSVLATPLLGFILGVLLGSFFANIGEQIARGKNVVLGLSAKEKQTQAKKKSTAQGKFF